MSFWFRPALCALALGALVLSPAIAQPQARAAQPKVSASQRRDVDRAVASYRRARKSPADLRAAVQRAVATGPHAAAALAPLLGDELQTRLNRYLDQLAGAASQAGRTLTIDPNHIAVLRARVLDLRNDEQLSKERVVAEGDPALAELISLLRVDPQSLQPRRGPSLSDERAALLDFAQLWQICAAAAGPASQSADPAAGDASSATGIAPDHSGQSVETLLACEEELALFAPGVISPAAARVLATNRQHAGAVGLQEYRGTQRLNALRLVLGLEPLALDPALAAAARDHAHDMRTLKFFSHDSPVDGKHSFTDRAVRFNTTASGENIYHGAPSADAALEAWFHSPGHFKNMLSEHRRVGVGVDQTHHVQLFGR